jgi:maleylacetate reductase
MAGGASMALLHKLCHTLGGSFDTPHVEMHAIRLPHMVGFNAAAVYDLLEPISAALGGATPGKALHRFASWLGALTRLKDLGLTRRTSIGRPRPLRRTRTSIRGLSARRR